MPCQRRMRRWKRVGAKGGLRSDGKRHPLASISGPNGLEGTGADVRACFEIGFAWSTRWLERQNQMIRNRTRLMCRAPCPSFQSLTLFRTTALRPIMGSLLRMMCPSYRRRALSNGSELSCLISPTLTHRSRTFRRLRSLISQLRFLKWSGTVANLKYRHFQPHFDVRAAVLRR